LEQFIAASRASRSVVRFPDVVPIEAWPLMRYPEEVGLTFTAQAKVLASQEALWRSAPRA
jgi:hypothetical protein